MNVVKVLIKCSQLEKKIINKVITMKIWHRGDSNGVSEDSVLEFQSKVDQINIAAN